MSNEYITQVLIYNNYSSMQKGISVMQYQGWEVVSTEAIKGNYGFGKTCCLGCIFLPLALLGQKGDKYKVQYRRNKASVLNNQQPQSINQNQPKDKPNHIDQKTITTLKNKPLLLAFIVSAMFIHLLCCITGLILSTAETNTNNPGTANIPTTNAPALTISPTLTPQSYETLLDIKSYIDKPMQEISNSLSSSLDSNGNITAEQESYSLFIEPQKDSNGTILNNSQYVALYLNKWGECDEKTYNAMDRLDEALIFAGLDSNLKGQTEYYYRDGRKSLVRMRNYESRKYHIVFGCTDSNKIRMTIYENN